jgi:DNA-binding transcriptional ArsR family regulator
VGHLRWEGHARLCGLEGDAVIAERHPSDLSSLRSWTFITNHGHVLLAVARNPAATVAELAAAAEITERSAYRILADLQRAGYVHRRKVGRQNAYEINPSLPLRDPTVENECVRDLLSLVPADVEGHLQRTTRVLRRESAA